jgi:hypothetical protein
MIERQCPYCGAWIYSHPSIAGEHEKRCAERRDEE